MFFWKHPSFSDFTFQVPLVKNTPIMWKMAEPIGRFWSSAPSRGSGLLVPSDRAVICSAKPLRSYLLTYIINFYILIRNNQIHQDASKLVGTRLHRTLLSSHNPLTQRLNLGQPLIESFLNNVLEDLNPFTEHEQLQWTMTKNNHAILQNPATLWPQLKNHL